MMIISLITTIGIPTIALVFPLVILSYHIFTKDLKVTIGRITVFKFSIVALLLTLMIFLLLTYFTGNIASYYSVSPGFYWVEGGFVYNLNTHISFAFQLDPGYSLLVVSFLSAILYSSLLILPKVCTYQPTSDTTADQTDRQTNSKSAGSTISGSITATVSAVASTAVCYSTSVAAVLAPTVLTLLGPLAPFLIYLAMALLIYSFYTIVLPRFPTIKQID